jgi:hypothetical protein
MTNIEPLDLDAIEERADAATEGPWTRSGIHIWGPDPENPEDRFDVEPDMIGRADLKMADAEFIAHAREDVPALIAEVRRLRQELGSGWDREDYIEDAFPEGFSGGLRNRPVIIYRGPWTRPADEETR